MLDPVKVAHEFEFLMKKIQEISSNLVERQDVSAAFKLGCLHSICHNHWVNVSQLIPPIPPVEEKKDEPQETHCS